MSDEQDPKAGTPDPEGTDDAAEAAALGGTPGEDGRDAGDEAGDGGGDDPLVAGWKAKAERTNALEEENARLREDLRRREERDPGLPASDRSLDAMQEELDEEATDLAQLRERAKNPADFYARQQLRDRERLLRATQSAYDQATLARIPEARRSTVEKLWDQVQAKGGDPRFPSIAALDRAVQWKQTQDENQRLKGENELLRQGKKPGPANGKLPASRRAASDVPPTDGAAPPAPNKGNAAPIVVKRAEFLKRQAELEGSGNHDDWRKSVEMGNDLRAGKIVYEEHLPHR